MEFLIKVILFFLTIVLILIDIDTISDWYKSHKSSPSLKSIFKDDLGRLLVFSTIVSIGLLVISTIMFLN